MKLHLLVLVGLSSRTVGCGRSLSKHFDLSDELYIPAFSPTPRPDQISMLADKHVQACIASSMIAPSDGERSAARGVLACIIFFCR